MKCKTKQQRANMLAAMLDGAGLDTLGKSFHKMIMLAMSTI